MNGIFPPDLVVYLLLAPLVTYVFLAHRWSGFLPWYYLSAFCLARIIGGILGIHDPQGLPANIIQSVGVTPLILGLDGLVHEGRVYRNPFHGRILGWSVVTGTTSLMAIALALSITGSLNIFEGHPKPDSLTQWKAGTVLIAVAWAFQVFWSLFSLLSGKGMKGAPGYHGGTALLQGAFVALLFVGVRVIYGMVSVCTQRRDLSPIYGSISVRVILMFLPEALAAITMTLVGIRTRHLRQTKLAS
ncbi:uncharacterized protein N7482_002374 [Penicillium canariense]|uniref:Integral membrane protein n=1 Tax=Penicillium canariense TaxID=189055 RepID=A0A9W9IHG7_9EURO|nr:uncharacterized protein N7482_002374 [Penicillium canariense]KAJ5176497.1 integral membrane protein [Penicillium canariense]